MTESEHPGGPSAEPLLATAAHAAAAIPGAARYAPGSIVGCELQCADCGYNLLTQPVSGRCPECGRAIEDSLFVLPQLDGITRAINLASWALLIKAVLSCAELEVAGLIILMVAAGNLYYKCDLTDMQEFRAKVKWLWITTLGSVIGSGLKVLGAIGFIAYLLLSSSGDPLNSRFVQSFNASFGSNTTTASDGTTTTSVFHNSMDGDVEVITDAQGSTTVQIVDDNGQVVSKKALQAGPPVGLQDAVGGTVNVGLATDGSVTVTTPNSATMTVGQRGGVSLRTTGFNQGLLVGLADGLVQLVGMAATILYVLICRGLARRARELKLAGNFQTILSLCVVGGLSMVLPLAGMRGLVSGGMGWIVIIGLVAGLAGICLLVAAIWLIVASFKLTSALRSTPRQWSDVVVMPGTGRPAAAATPPFAIPPPIPPGAAS